MRVPQLSKQDFFPLMGFPIVIHRREPQPNYGLHTHDFSELVLVTKGKGVHYTQAENWTIQAGDVFVIHSPLAHGFKNLQGLHLINLLFDPEPLVTSIRSLRTIPGWHSLFNPHPRWRKNVGLPGSLHLPEAAREETSHLVKQLESELLAQDRGFEAMATNWFMLLCGLLSRRVEASVRDMGEGLGLMPKAIGIIEDQWNQPLNISRLADECNMKTSTFFRRFQQLTGTSPIHFQLQLRMDKASVILEAGRESIEMVASKCGFTDSNYFTRQFRKHMGMSPRQYRVLRTK